jgi:hypothetical protein
MGHKERLIFQLTLAQPDNREKEYKIFEGKPSFFNLDQKGKQDFINCEVTKVKRFLDREYRKHPH